ncbi:MAG: hypothetical protein KGL39_44420 [Patescibacteria group bacterium]|nr:hypothetical protein [Patescibacteria group bacterium]
MWAIFKRRQETTQQQGGFYRHRLAESARINGGGEEWAFLSRFGLPVEVYRGSGRTVQASLSALAPGTVVQYPIGAPLGIPMMSASEIAATQDLTANPVNGFVGY